MNRPDRAVVVGGGITGLTAALRLSQAGTDVTLVEPRRLGGWIQTSMVAGRAVDETADAFLLRVPWALALCHDLEIDGELVSPAARQASIWVDGRHRRLPARHLMGVPTDLDALAASGLLTPEGSARVAAETDLGRRPGDPGPGPAGTDVAIGSYLRGRLGDEAVDHLIDPLVGGINAGDTAELSLAAVVPQLDAAARSADPSLIRSCRDLLGRATTSSDAPIFAAPLGGMARIVDALLAFTPGVDLRLGRRAVAVETSGQRATVTLDDDTALEADAVVLAVPAHVAANLLPPVSAEAAQTMSAIDHSSIAMITLAFDRGSLADDLPEGTSGTLVPRDQGLLVTAVSSATNKWAQLRDPERDDTILRVSVGRTGDTRHLDLDDPDLIASALDDLDRLYGVIGGPTDVRVVRCPDAFPQYTPGHLDRIDAVDRSLEPTPVRVAGMSLRGVGIPACVRSGEEAAASLGASWPTRRSLESPAP